MSGQVAIIGAGPAGLAAAIELRRLGVGEVVVFEREQAAGGIPRHADHQGFGLRDLRRVMSGPAYARRYAQLAHAAGAEIRTSSMVTGWGSDGSLEVTSPTGRYALRADATLLATGCRERPRSARLIPGNRPAGVMTTGTLQQLVHLTNARVGRRAVVVGAEHVSFSALATLAHAGVRSVCMSTEYHSHQSFEVFRLGARVRYRTPLLTRTRITAIYGGSRVEGAELTNLDSGRATQVSCDLVVLSADWIPDHELAVAHGVELDPITRGPAVDGAMRTSRTGVFAAGNVLHGAETADVAALEGRHAARQIASYLRGGQWPELRVPIICQVPLGWIYPNVISPPELARPARHGGYRLRARTFLSAPELAAIQDGSTVWTGTVRKVQPGRSVRLPDGFDLSIAGDRGPVTLAAMA